MRARVLFARFFQQFNVDQGARRIMSGSVSHGLKLLVAADPDPARWPLLISLAQALAELDVRIHLVPTRLGLDEQQREDAAAVPGLVLIEPGLGLDPRHADPACLMDARRDLAQLARELDVELVQVDLPALADARFPCPVVALHLGCPVTRWEAVHAGPLPDPFAWRSELIRAGLEAADVVICPSLAHAQRVKNRFALRETPYVVHAGRAPLPVSGSAQHDYVLTAGALWDESSNLAVLDAAASRIGVPVRAAGPVRSPKGDEVMFDNLHCLGNLGEEEIARWLSARPVFVSTALYDPLGLSILLAASAGCPLILSDIPDFRELWDEVAMFVDPNDEKGFSDAIGHLVGDDFERAVIGRAARERAARHSPRAMAAQMAAIYRSLLPAVHRPVLAAKAAA